MLSPTSKAALQVLEGMQTMTQNTSDQAGAYASGALAATPDEAALCQGIVSGLAAPLKALNDAVTILKAADSQPE